MAMRRALVYGVVALGGWLAACGGADGDGEGPRVGGGEVAPPWDAMCVATFTRDHAFVDGFGDVELRVKAGARYLMSDFGSFGSAATVLYLTAQGPVDFGVEVADGEPPPFSSSCSEGAVNELVGVFLDTPVYADEALTMPACMLAEGSTHAGGLNFALVSGDLFAGGGVYQVGFAGLPGECGLTAGYVEASSVMLGSTEYTILPLASVLSPN